MKKVLLFLADGFEEIEALTVVDVLRRGNVKCDTCSINGEMVSGGHGIQVKADLLIDSLKIKEYDAVVLPGGIPGSTNLRDDERVIDVIKKFNKENKIIAAICAAPIVLAKADVIKNKKITSYPGYENELQDCTYIEEVVVQDENIITSRGPATALYFAYKLMEILVGKEVENGLREGMLVNFLESSFNRK